MNKETYNMRVARAVIVNMHAQRLILEIVNELKLGKLSAKTKRKLLKLRAIEAVLSRH